MWTAYAHRSCRARSGSLQWFRRGAVTAKDLWPLVTTLSHDEQVRLAKLAAAGGVPAADLLQYQATPAGAHEFSSSDDPLGWDAEGWDDLTAAR